MEILCVHPIHFLFLDSFEPWESHMLDEVCYPFSTTHYSDTSTNDSSF